MYIPEILNSIPAEHAWIGGAVLDGSVWRWTSSGKELDSSISEELPIDDFYGLTINVHSKELKPFKLKSLSLSPGQQTIHSYVCETGPRETEQTGSSVPQTVALTACERQLKKSKQDYQSLVEQVLVADCPCSTLSVLEAKAVVKDQRISILEADNILSQNLTDCRDELGRKEGEMKVLRVTLGLEDDSGIEDIIREVLRRDRERISALEGELEKMKELRERDEMISSLHEMISSLQRELEASRKTTALPATTEATKTLEQPPKPQEQATDFLIPNMTFSVKKSDYQGDSSSGEAKSNVVEAGGLRWRVSFFWESKRMTRFLVHAEGGRGAPSPWTLTVQSLTVKVLRKGKGGEPRTYRLEGATFSSEKGVVGMISRWGWYGLTDPSEGFLDPQGTLHVEVSFEGASMSPSPPPQRPTVWEAEASLQLRDFTSSLREEGDRIYSPSVHVGGKEWRVMLVRSDGVDSFSLLCNPEERSDWSLKADWTITLLSVEGGRRNGEEKMDGVEFSRGSPYAYALNIPRASVDRFLTGDTLSVAVVNPANGPPDLKLKMAPLPVGSPGPRSAPLVPLSTAPQWSRFHVVQLPGFQVKDTWHALA
ncbi:unnamed protein product [Cyprideis torosa]|uniref:Uncharacterized protein n=1 Tax=Cyprideis torosa TaxID=163714 RepID=A0A7R8WAI2_9CRUS|nr:unnamed protein product [Cyprideis torosa]CAG0891056.1 unnamed protein product [Cyprideis torosa]